MKKVLFLILLFLYSNVNFGQTNSRNGRSLPATDTIRVFIVFGEVIGDPNDPGGLWVGNGSWETGNLPPNKDLIINHSISNSTQLVGITKYFHEVSNGKLIVLGDYYPEIVQIDYSDATNGSITEVCNFFNNLQGQDIITQNGYSFNSNDFDSWTTNTNYNPSSK
ncbi:MAG: hypothetical protein PHD45_09650 [Bacteroidales bacterium]|nr:hypothetical protein [Bacteroidales bacterium]